MIVIINGPNLNLLGRREPQVYGRRSFDEYLAELRNIFPDLTIDYFQSNHEGELIDYIQKMGFLEEVEGIILNPGAFAHYSYALADAIRAIEKPVVEVHISNIHAREEFRHKTVTGSACAGIISGLGLEGYKLGIEYLLSK